ncbi:MAG: ABC transporter permease [Candidatus Electrothrix sp.]
MNRIRLPRNVDQLIYLRDLLRELIIRDLKLRYKRSILGIAWTLVNPLTQLLVLLFVFNSVIQLDIPHYTSFLFSGLIIWYWFHGGLIQATGSIVANRDLIRRPGFPSPILPVVAVLSHLIHFLLALPVLIVFLIIDDSSITGAIVVLPLIIALQFLVTLSISYAVAAFHVTFRDTQYMLGVLLNFLFYLTPIFYELEAVPDRFRPFYNLNPMAHLIDAYRDILIQGILPQHPVSLIMIAFLGTVLLIIGHGYFVRASYTFVEEL